MSLKNLSSFQSKLKFSWILKSAQKSHKCISAFQLMKHKFTCNLEYMHFPTLVQMDIIAWSNVNGLLIESHFSSLHFLKYLEGSNTQLEGPPSRMTVLLDPRVTSTNSSGSMERSTGYAAMVMKASSSNSPWV